LELAVQTRIHASPAFSRQTIDLILTTKPGRVR
jgi:hypothetical protein